MRKQSFAVWPRRVESSRQFSLDKNLAEVNMAAIIARFVYIAWGRQDVVQSVVNGEILVLKLKVEDSTESQRN